MFNYQLTTISNKETFLQKNHEDMFPRHYV